MTSKGHLDIWRILSELGKVDFMNCVAERGDSFQSRRGVQTYSKN